MAPDEKLCPFCAEVIKAAAVRCRWCGSDLPVDAATEETSVSEVSPTPPVREPEGSGSPRRLTPALVAAVLGVLVLVAAAGLWVVVHNAAKDTVAPDGQLTSEGARRAIMQQGAALTTKVMSYRAAQSASDIKAAESVMTPRMKAEYEKSLPPQDQRGTQAELGIEVKASVASMSGANGACQPADCAVALLSATRSSADLLVFVDQDATAKGGKNTVVSPTWERVRLVKRDGVWLVDDMSAS